MGWQELHIQSNIPLIVLTISLICIAIIGFLEFKKLSHRINELALEVHNIKNEEGTPQIKEKKVEEKKVEEKKVEEKKVEEKEEILNEEINMMEKMMPHGDAAEIIMGMPPPNMMPGGIASMIIGGPPMMPMGEIHMQTMFEEGMDVPPMDIQEEKTNHFEEVVDEDVDKEDIKIDEDIEDEEENEEEDEFSEEEDEFSGSESELGSESESGSESEEEEAKIELIQGKGKVEEIKDKDVDRSLSIKELKEICQMKGLSTSGNKETLIKRINSKK